jgi:hypothetical protein
MKNDLVNKPSFFWQIVKHLSKICSTYTGCSINNPAIRNLNNPAKSRPNELKFSPVIEAYSKFFSYETYRQITVLIYQDQYQNGFFNFYGLSIGCPVSNSTQKKSSISIMPRPNGLIFLPTIKTLPHSKSTRTRLVITFVKDDYWPQQENFTLSQIRIKIYTIVQKSLYRKRKSNISITARPNGLIF